MQRILVIDDEPSIRELLKDFFTGKGFEVVTSHDGETALNLLKENKFDLLLLDLMMPGMNGMDVLREIASENLTIPSIMITAYASVSTAVEAMKLGAFDYITKPFVLEDVYLKVSRALDVSKLKEEESQA